MPNASYGRVSPVVVLLAVLGVVLTLCSSISAHAAASATHTHEKVLGFFRGWPGDCPDDLPDQPLVCHEWDITAYDVGTDEQPGGISPPHTGWVLIALHHTLTFPGGGGEPVESDVALGFRDGADVSFDQAHLSTATVRAPDLALDDGDVVDLQAIWTATSPRMMWGNDGPALDEFGHVHHLHAPCLTEEFQAHQKFRLAHVVAVVDGVTSRYDGRFAFLAYNQFISVQVQPASCG
jgi:hypothetical protein